MDLRNCPYCNGTGRDPHVKDVCRVCNGTGKLPAFSKERLCVFCNETGRDPYDSIPCRKCHGHGVIYEGPIEFIYISGRKPYTDRRTIQDILEQATGEVRIIETYFGKGTLDMLRSIPDTCAVRILVGKITDVSVLEIKTFRKEHSRFEFRQQNQLIKLGGLHDRYLVDDRGLLVLGHGLKEIGNKESFAILLEEPLVPA